MTPRQLVLADGGENVQSTNVARAPVVIADDFLLKKNPKDEPFLYPPEYEGHLAGVLIPIEDILDRTAALAKAISEDYKGERPVLICLLKGAGQFYFNLLQALQKERQGYLNEFIRAKSYEGSSSTGNVEISGMNLARVKDKKVILVDDIVDTGTTVSKIIPMLMEEGCKSVEICTMLEKRLHEGKHQQKITCKYSGFSIPDEFVVGHGLDYDQIYRDLADIWIMSEEGIKAGGKV